MKPESWPVAEETHWKSWKFKEIVSDAVEQDNLRVRKELATMQEKFSHQERLHDCVKAELETEREHKLTLQKSLDTAYAFIKSTQQDAAKTARILAAVMRQRDRYRTILREYGQSTSIDIPDAPSSIISSAISELTRVDCSFEPPEDISAAKAMMEDEEETKQPVLSMSPHLSSGTHHTPRRRRHGPRRTLGEFPKRACQRTKRPRFPQPLPTSFHWR